MRLFPMYEFLIIIHLLNAVIMRGKYDSLLILYNFPRKEINNRFDQKMDPNKQN